MSIIERYSPLNLAYKVIVVTNASSPLGIVVCNTLLKSNALVLATDNQPKHEGFSEGAYTHFQFCKCDLADEKSAGLIIADAQKKFKVEQIDALVNIASVDDDAKMQEAHQKVAIACAGAMKEDAPIVNMFLQGGGSGAGDGASKATDQMISTTKELSSDSQLSKKKVRCNMIALSVDQENVQKCKEFEEAKSHMGYLFKESHNPNIKAKPAEENTVKMYECSNVSLFLASEMSKGLNGVVLTPNGSRISS